MVLRSTFPLLFVVLPIQLAFSQNASIKFDTTVISEADLQYGTYLLKNGIEIRRERVNCWFPKDSLSEERMYAIVDTINAGIKATEKFIKAPLAWQKHGINISYTFFFPAEKLISHAYTGYGYIFIPFWRIESWRAPWLHEAIHAILASKYAYNTLNLPKEEFNKIYAAWLVEGIAVFLSNEVGEKEGFRSYDPFSDSFRTDVDSLFLENIKEGKGLDILPFIGSKGNSELLYGENRKNYAPTFYHGSSSLVKYIARHYGLDILLEAVSIANWEHVIIEERTGKTMEEIKKDWKMQLGIE